MYVLLKCGQLAGLALFKEKYVAVYVLWLTFLGHIVLIFPPNCGKMRKGVGQESIPLSLTVFFPHSGFVSVCVDAKPLPNKA